MLYCACGYTCGTQAALSRHIEKFATKGDDVSQHVAIMGPPELPDRLIKSAPVSVSLESRDDDTTTEDTAGGCINAPIIKIVMTPTAAGSFPQASLSPTSPPASPGVVDRIRLVLIRHGQSGNKDRREGEPASPDPGLTELGLQQAEALGHRLVEWFKLRQCSLAVVCSPMRRCILTILPALRDFGVAEPPNGLVLPQDCVCHGGAYEFGCCGTLYTGTTLADITAEFPQFTPIGFSKTGHWDYRGTSEKESQGECRDRALRIAAWLQTEVAPMLRARPLVGKSKPTVLFVTHQTIADLLCQVLIEGTAAWWNYGEIQYKIGNASISEIFLMPDGQTVLGNWNDNFHLLDLPASSPAPSPMRALRPARKFATLKW